MSDYISKSEVMTILTDVELKEGTFTEAKSKIRDIPPVDEKEIIRNAFERVVERLEEYRNFEDNDSLDRQCIDRAIEIVKEECGINE